MHCSGQLPLYCDDLRELVNGRISTRTHRRYGATKFPHLKQRTLVAGDTPLMEPLVDGRSGKEVCDFGALTRALLLFHHQMKVFPMQERCPDRSVFTLSRNCSSFTVSKHIAAGFSSCI